MKEGEDAACKRALAGPDRGGTKGRDNGHRQGRTDAARYRVNPNRRFALNVSTAAVTRSAASAAAARAGGADGAQREHLQLPAAHSPSDVQR